MKSMRGAGCYLFNVLTLVLLAIIFTSASQAQEKTAPLRYMLSNQASKRSVGSAKLFSGRICIFHVFANDAQASWSEPEKDEVRSRLEQACDFLSQQSELHGHKISFIEEFAPTVSYEKRLPTGTFVNPNWTEEVIRESSGIGSRELVDRLRDNHSADNVVVCLHVNKPALSYNLAYYANVSSTFTAERMVCFSTYPDSRPTAAATYAHEILHLFGAGDLYFPYDQDEYRKRVAKRLFPNDVMLRVDYNLQRLNVGAFTAYRVGWLNQIDPAHKLFED